MPAWPATLPQYVLQEGYQEKLPDNTVETPMDTGPDKVRRRFTTNYRVFTVQMEMTAAQAAVFDGFYVTTLRHGSLDFDWVHPITQAPAVFRFRKPPPQKSVRGEAVRYGWTMIQKS